MTPILSILLCAAILTLTKGTPIEWSISDKFNTTVSHDNDVNDIFNTKSSLTPVIIILVSRDEANEVSQKITTLKSILANATVLRNNLNSLNALEYKNFLNELLESYKRSGLFSGKDQKNPDLREFHALRSKVFNELENLQADYYALTKWRSKRTNKFSKYS